MAKKKQTDSDVKGVNHRKMKLRGGPWDGVVVRQYADKINKCLQFDDLTLTVGDTAHLYVEEQPPRDKQPGTMRHVKKL